MEKITIDTRLGKVTGTKENVIAPISIRKKLDHTFLRDRGPM